MGIVLKGQTLASVAVMQAGSIEAFPQFLIDNGFDLETDIATGTAYVVPENVLYKSFRSVADAPLIEIEQGEYEHVLTYGQSIVDVCAQVYGSLDSLVDMMVLNSLGKITDTVKAGTKLRIDRTKEYNPAIVKYFAVREMRVNNRLSYARSAAGIGYMGIGFDFIVD